jgi:threonine dehydrogenase-like Zn-dependent dehydrogenase
MKALVLEEYNRLIYKDVSDPVISDNEVLVKVMACGICGSDVHGLDGSTGRRIPPLIMGHEASGVIAETGKAVTGWAVGDRVTFDSTVYPQDDWFTLNRMYNLSDNREVLGVSPGPWKRNGAFAEYISIPQHILHRIPPQVTFEQAAMVEGAAVALHAINLAGVNRGEICCVTGSGSIGLFIIKLLRISGAGRVIAVDSDKKSLDRAEAAGADYIFEVDDINLMEKVKALSGGRGADISFEAVGKSESVNLAIDIVRKGGKVVLVGNISPYIQFPLQKVVSHEIKVSGSCAICGEYPAILDLINSGKLLVDDQISVIAPLSEGAEWFRKLYNKEGNLSKIILVP